MADTSAKYQRSHRQRPTNATVPEALGALKESALALDLYAWLAQRLWRVHPKEAAFITWAALKQQFGPDYHRMADFKRKFRQALRDVRAVYPDARLDTDDQGMTLFHSPRQSAAASLPQANGARAGERPESIAQAVTAFCH